MKCCLGALCSLIVALPFMPAHAVAAWACPAGPAEAFILSLTEDGSAPGAGDTPGEGGGLVAQWSMAPHDRLEIGFVHSSEHVRVSSVFEVREGELHAVETRMEGFGPGLPWDGIPAQDGPLLSRQPLALTYLALRAGPATGHSLRIGDEHIDLSALVPPDKRSATFLLELEPHCPAPPAPDSQAVAGG